MKFSLITLPTIIFWSGVACSQEELPRPLAANVQFSGQMTPYDSYMRHRYQWKGNDFMSVSFTSQKQGPGFLKRELTQGVGIPLDFRFGKNNSGLSFTIQTDNAITPTRKYMFNWYLSRRLSKRLNANLNLYSDKTGQDKSLAYANLNASFQFQVSPRMGLNVGSYAEKSLITDEVVMNHVIRTSFNF
jgi:hypothetical protein